MNLAEAIALLSQREELKNKVTNEIRQYMEWKEKGYSGLVTYTVFQVDGFHSDAKYSFDYTIAENDTFKSQNKTNLLLNEKVEVFVQDKNGYTDLICTVTLGSADEEILPKDEETALAGVVPNAPSAVYAGRFYFQGIPDTGEMRDIVEAKTDGERLVGSDPIFHIKVSFDDFETAIRSRELEIEQIEKEIHNARTQVKDAQKSNSPTKTTATKKPLKKGSEKKRVTKKKPAAVQNSALDNELPPLEPLEPPTPWTEIILEKGAQAVEFAFENRAYLLFGIASIGIYFYGDYASV